MKRLRWLIISFLICLVSTGAYAEEKKKWADQAELTFVDTGGNVKGVRPQQLTNNREDDM